MANYARPKAVDELPPRAPHTMSVALSKRAALVARNSRNGKWTRYAHFPSRATAETKFRKWAAGKQFSQIGRLESAIRFETTTGRWVLFLRFKTFAQPVADVDNNVAFTAAAGDLDAEEVSDLPDGERL